MPTTHRGTGAAKETATEEAATATPYLPPGKETENSKRTSSLPILQAVHASRALLAGSNLLLSQQLLQQGGAIAGAPSGFIGGVNVGLLRPNQLKYSPSSSSGGGASTGRMVSLA